MFLLLFNVTFINVSSNVFVVKKEIIRNQLIFPFCKILRRSETTVGNCVSKRKFNIYNNPIDTHYTHLFSCSYWLLCMNQLFTCNNYTNYGLIMEQFIFIFITFSLFLLCEFFYSGSHSLKNVCLMVFKHIFFKILSNISV